VVVGDVEVEPLRGAVERAFSGWEGGVDYHRVDARPSKDTRQRTIVISIPGMRSVWYGSGVPIRLPVSSPEAVQLEVANEIFGGETFMSRLLSNVRDREGLTYGVGSKVWGDAAVKTAFVITGWFTPSVVSRGLASVEAQLRSYCAAGPMRDELRDAQQYLMGAYKIRLATTQGLADKVLACAEQGRDLGSIDRYCEDIESVTLDQVSQALRKYVRPSRFVTVLAGSVPGTTALSHPRHPLRRPD
jgi:zinc protease